MKNFIINVVQRFRPRRGGGGGKNEEFNFATDSTVELKILVEGFNRGR